MTEFKGDSSNQPSGELDASFISKATYQWLRTLLVKGASKPLETSDLYALDEENQAEVIAKKFETAWKSLDNSSGSLEMRVLRAAVKAYGSDYIVAAAYLLGYNTIQLICPIIIHYLLIWLESPSSLWIPYVLVLVLFTLQLLAVFLYNYQFELASKTGYRLRTGISITLYKKYFRLSNAARHDFSVGKIVNITSTDTLKIDLATQYFNMIWTGIYLIIATCVVLYIYVGVATIAGMAVIIAYLPCQLYLSKANSSFRKAANVFTDNRMRIIHESLKGIRVIKAYSWEKSFLKVIFDIRRDEIKQIRRYLFARAATSSVTQVVPTFAMIITFVIYSAIGNSLSISTIIPTLALFYGLRVPMLFIPISVANTIDSWIAFNRIGTFLDAKELSNRPLISNETDSIYSVKLSGCDFEWDQDFKLTDININIPKGDLVLICGTVGSGKSSLLQALIGDMLKTRGEISLYGSVGYCQQQAWITNTSLRENILFGLEYDEERYNQVIKICSLERDLSLLDGGDQTEIGEQGINLSGGQKARLGLARAVYSDSDIYILDDPLSAVDAHVGKYLFEECIAGKLQSKTRILVTHQLHYLHKADSIILMEKGRVIAQGSYEDLIACSAEFAKLIQNYDGDKEKDNEELESQIIELSPSLAKQASDLVLAVPELNLQSTAPIASKLMTIEERAKGSIDFDIIKHYLRFAGGAIFIASLAFSLVFSNVLRIVTDQWLIFWAIDKYNLSWNVYVIVYASIAFFQMVFAVLFGYATSLFGSKASNDIHNKAMTLIYRSPIHFFDRTPLGRMTSRFSRDVDTLDSLLPEAIRAFIWTLWMCLFNLCVIAYFIPAFLGAIFIVSFGYYYLQKQYRATARELRRLDSVSRSPVIAMITETLTGLTTIRSFKAVDRFIAKNSDYVNENNRAQYLVLISQRWVQLRLDLMNSALVFFTALIAVSFRNQINPGVTGILIAYALQVTQTFTWTIKTGTDVETFFNSAERLIFYINNLESEAPAVLDNRVPASWPSAGKIIFNSVSLRYRPELPFVLEDITFKIEAGSKIAIVGRTAAGKSTILTAMLRLTEYEAGSITIDDIDITKIGLEDLRTNLAIIPQEPMLFSGTVRFNLDPFSNSTDDDLWDVLERSNLKHVVSALPLGIDSPVSEGGENWSVGQRQLLCLARAMLRHSKVILLDEATASVDFETDEYIQNAIRRDFIGCTIITIAHRLNTIADYDRVIVMSFGRIKEYATPHSLLLNPESEFAKLVGETGLKNASIIKQLARQKHLSSA